MSELVIVPPHLIERIKAILVADLELPEELRAELKAGLEQPEPTPSVEGDESVPQRPATIDINVLERLSRWATSDDHESVLRAAGIGNFFDLELFPSW